MLVRGGINVSVMIRKGTKFYCLMRTNTVDRAGQPLTFVGAKIQKPKSFFSLWFFVSQRPACRSVSSRRSAP